jgi:hypothetical protein
VRNYAEWRYARVEDSLLTGAAQTELAIKEANEGQKQRLQRFCRICGGMWAMIKGDESPKGYRFSFVVKI